MTYLIPSDAYPVICPECAGSRQETRTEVVPVEGYDNRVTLRTTFQRCFHTAIKEISVDTTEGSAGDNVPAGVTVDWGTGEQFPLSDGSAVASRPTGCCGGGDCKE